jgi:nitroreductase
VEFSAEEVNSLKQAPLVEGLLPSILKRWSARSFAGRAVTDPQLQRLFEAARWSASAYNEQPWRFVVGRKGTETFDRILASLIGFNQDWARRAPVLILGLARAEFSHNGTPNGYALFDLGAATAQLALQAAEQGLSTHQMAGFDAEAARASLGIPAEYLPGTVIALGYQDDPATLGNEKLEQMETTPRQRKPLSELVFSAWNQPADLG